MTFQQALDEAIAILRRQGRVSCRALKRQFDVDDGFIDDLRAELVETLQLATELDGQVLAWKGADAPGAAAPLLTAAESPAAAASAASAAASVTAALAPAASASAGSERRQLTVMFCDVADATELAGQLDAEDLQGILRAYQTVIAEVVERMGGHIAQYLGDGVLVYFGFPRAHDDDVRRAVASGLEIIANLAALRADAAARHGARFAVRIGVHTGSVVVGAMGAGARLEQLAVGETPNIASRVQALAAPDSMLVTAPAWRLVAGYFIGQAQGEHRLKGVAEAMTVFRVTGESGAQSRLDIAHGELTPLVGRESETQLLLGRWALSCDGDGQVVLLRGEPGIGKSRLALFVQDHVREQGGECVRFRCSPYRVNSAFYPVIEQLARVVGLQRDDTPETQRAKLQRAVPPLAFATDVVWPLLARLLSVPLADMSDATAHLSPQQQRQLTQEVLADWMFKLAEHKPLLVLWDDLHWADPSTLGFIGLLMEQVGMSRVFMLLTSRPEFVPPWTPRSHLSQLTLDRLTRAEMETMVARIVRSAGFPPEVVQQVVAKTDGVPLFVEELLKMILESGLMRQQDGRPVLSGQLSGQLPDLAIPATLQDSLMARLDRLSNAREVAQIGAAIGREFSHTMIQAVAMLDDATLEHGLAQLAEGEVIYRHGRPPTATYSFKHALIRDAAYQSLLKSRRHFFHGRIAQVLAERFPEVVANEPELLAHHLSEAALHEQAITHWQRAAQRAIERSANSEGIAHLGHALNALRQLPEGHARAQYELELRVALGVPLIATRGYADAEVEATYSRARELALWVGETPQLPNILWGLWVFYLCGGSLGTALAMGEQYRSVAMAHPDDDGLLLETCQLLGIVRFYRGEYAAALPHLEQGSRLYDPARHHALIFAHGGADTGVAIASHLALVQWSLGLPDRAQASMQQAMHIAQQLAHPFSLAFAHYFNAWLHALRRDERAAQDAARSALTICDEYGFPFWGLASSVLHGCALAAQGHAEAGLAQMKPQLDAYAAIGGLLHYASMRALLAKGYAARGEAADTALALHEVNAGLAALEGRDERWYEPELHRLQGELLLASDGPGAMAALQRALDTARRQGARAWELRAAVSLARLHAGEGRHAQGLALLAAVEGVACDAPDLADLRAAQALFNSQRETMEDNP